MPIAINGSGTITGISAGGLPDGVITTDDIAANAVTTAKLGTNEASGLAKAWVNFNGTSTVAIRAQYNVSSITDNGTGDYTVNFTTALADANYSLVGNSDSQFSIGPQSGGSGSYTTSSARITSSRFSTGVADAAVVCIAVFR